MDPGGPGGARDLRIRFDRGKQVKAQREEVSVVGVAGTGLDVDRGAVTGHGNSGITGGRSGSQVLELATGTEPLRNRDLRVADSVATRSRRETGLAQRLERLEAVHGHVEGLHEK